MDRREPWSHGPAGKAPRQASPLRSPSRACGRPSTQSGGQQAWTQDWVCEPPESRPASRRWSVSIEERRQLATQDGGEEPGTGGPDPHYRDIAQLVAQLVSEDVDKDVLLPHPLRSSESAHAFHAFLARSSPFWQTATSKAQVSRSLPS
ncbi:testis-expressed protein 22 isoform X1 [Lutra lutra]|uniref:testis-expressed protein 22 isoform X1 n=1 Tax=Lutra lutra TaxID=9657 RepID=UPI001FD4CC34|nr:testis-expressed protein 22 isoform X1 [Lutra lutra]